MISLLNYIIRKFVLLPGLFLLFISGVSCSGVKEIYVSTSFHEPANEGLRFIYSLDGMHWDSVPGVWLNPQVGNQRVLRDPSIVESPDGVYHLVWTSSWKGDLGFGYAESKDLIHWSTPKLIPVMKSEPTTINVWAPEIFYDKTKKEFIVIWASCIPGRFAKGIEDEENNHRLFYITTKDFNTFSETKLLFDPGFSSIDATLVKKNDSDYVLVFKDNTRPCRNLKVAFAKTPVGPFTNVSNAFTESYTEGPTVEKIKDEYLIYYDAYRNFNFGAAKTKDFIHFSDVTNQVSVPKNHKHGTIFTAPESLIKKLISTYELSQAKLKNSETKIISEVK